MEYYDEVVEIRKSSPVTVEIPKNMPTDEKETESKRKGSAILAPPKRPPSSISRIAMVQKGAESFGSETESSDSEPAHNSAGGPEAKSHITDHKEWEKLSVPSDIKDLFQYILRYSPPKVEIDYVLQPFIPEYIPAVGDIDAFLKVVPASVRLRSVKLQATEHIASLGLRVLDEPSGQQSEPALLHMKLRSVLTHSRTPGGSSGGTSTAPPPPSISRSGRDIEKWISEIKDLYVNQPFPIVHRRKQQNAQDIDALMNEWPTDMERMLNNFGFPNAFLNCTLPFYIELVCSLLDIVIPSTRTQADYIFALSTLFNLYLAVKSPTQ